MQGGGPNAEELLGTDAPEEGLCEGFSGCRFPWCAGTRVFAEEDEEWEGLHLLTYLLTSPSPPASSEFVHIRICEWGSCEVVYVLYSAGDWGLGTGDWMGWNAMLPDGGM